MADVEMVERVARAIEPILAVQAQYHCWNSVIFRRKLARAAVEAMWEPTDAMLEAGPQLPPPAQTREGR